MKFPGDALKGFSARVAPPRGERGLKCPYRPFGYDGRRVAPPRGERGLKSAFGGIKIHKSLVAPPRGERGLKSSVPKGVNIFQASLPLVGSVD